MSVIEAEIKARSEYKNNPGKVLDKLSYAYCQRKALIPYEMTNDQFNEVIAAYKKQFPNGTILDALWAYNNQCKLYSTDFASRIPLALGQIAEFEGKYEIALRNFFECLVLEFVEDLDSFETLAAYHKEYQNDPIKYLSRGGDIDYLNKGSLVGDRIAQIIKKSQESKRLIFQRYKYQGSCFNCCLTTEQINKFICDHIVE